jgi:hypothetical protein
MQDEEAQKRVPLGKGHCCEDGIVLANVITLLLPEAQGADEMVLEKFLVSRPTADKTGKEASMASGDFWSSTRVFLHIADCKFNNLTYDRRINPFSPSSPQEWLYNFWEEKLRGKVGVLGLLR